MKIEKSTPSLEEAIRSVVTGTKVVQEEVEELEELSKNTLSRYIRIASDRLADSAEDKGYYGRGPAKTDKGEDSADRKKYLNARRETRNKKKGIERAARHLAKENIDFSEEEIDFIKNTLKLDDHLDESQFEGKHFNAKDYHATSEKSQFGGHRPKIVHKKQGTMMYLGQASYNHPHEAKEHAKDYLRQYSLGNHEPDVDHKGTAKTYSLKHKNSEHSELHHDGKHVKTFTGPDAKSKAISHMHKLTGYVKEETEELSKEDLYMSQISKDANRLDEKRGRPAKEGSAAWKRQQSETSSQADEPRHHIIPQLQRAKVSMNGGSKVKFKDGSEHHIAGHHASKLLDKYMDLKPTQKLDFQKKIGASHEALKTEL